MSVRVLSWVFDHSSVEHRADLLVLLVLADHAHDDGTNAFPSVETIARKARLSRRGVYAALKRLKAVGAIVRDGAGPRGTVSYSVVMEPVQPMHGAATAPVQAGAPGGAGIDTRGVQGTAPEPSIEPSLEPSLSPSSEAKDVRASELVEFDPRQLPRPWRAAA